MNKTEKFLREIHDIQKKEIPVDVCNRARQSLLDYLAVASAGAAFQSSKIKKYIAFAQPEKGEYYAVGTGSKFALKEAVFLNGLNGHALDFDDGTNSGIIHLGSPIFSLLLPLAQRHDKKIADMLKAAVIGYETSYTMAVSIQPKHKMLGYHATGTCGVLGAVIAASYMLEFTEEERFQAFSAACASASGLLMVLDEGSELKPYNVAKTSLLALTSIQMAKAGFKGHPDPLGGQRGFLKMMTGASDIELCSPLRNGTYAIQKTYTKPYASCRYTHPSVEAAIYLRNRYGLTEKDVVRIDIKTYALAVAGHDHTDIPGTYSAKMSIPYSVAAGLIYGKAGLQEFSEEKVKDENVLALTKRVYVVSDETLSNIFPQKQAAVMEITTRERTLSVRIDFPKGEPENPLSEGEFKERYYELMRYAGVEQDAGAKVFDAVYQEETAVDEMMNLFGSKNAG